MSRLIRNRKAYDSVDVNVTVNGFPLEVVEIEYDTEQEHQVNHTLGADATSWSQGKKTHSCTVTVMMHDMTPIEQSAGGDLLKVKPFDINVSFINDYNVPVNDTILAKFQNQGRSVTGDMGLNKQYTLLALDISLNNPI